MKPAMNLVTGMIRSILGNAVALLSFSLLTQIATGYTANQLSTSTMQNYQHTTVPYAYNKADHINLHSHQLSDDEVKLNIIEREIRNFAKILMPYNEAYKHQRNKRGTASSPTPAPNTPSRFTMIENQISQLQENLTNLKKNMNDETKIRIAELESIITELQKSLDFLSKEQTDREIAHNKTITVLTQKLNKEICIGITQSIQLRQFALADQQLKLSDDINIEDIVELVYSYNNTGGNIDSIQSFGEYISEAELKLKIFQTLFNLMRTNRHRDVWTLIRQVQSLKKDVLGRVANATAAQSLFDTLGDSIQAEAIEPISASFLYNNSWLKITSLSITLVDNFPQLVQNTYDKVIEKISNALDIKKILNEAEQIDHLESKMSVHHAIFHKLERYNTLNTNISIILARSTKAVVEHPNYENVSLNWKRTYKSMINKLPQSVKNLVFSSIICIKNLDYNEYLYASDSKYRGEQSDSEIRSVYTWIPKNRSESLTFRWRIYFNDDHQIEFVNVEYGEKLFASNLKSDYYGFGRLIYTYTLYEIKDSSKDARSKWNIEMDGEGLQIKNVVKNEYLFVHSDRKYNPDRRYVYSFAGQGNPTSRKWEIIDCSPCLCNCQPEP